jgi:hypothetical protein
MPTRIHTNAQQGTDHRHHRIPFLKNTSPAACCRSRKRQHKSCLAGNGRIRMGNVPCYLAEVATSIGRHVDAHMVAARVIIMSNTFPCPREPCQSHAWARTLLKLLSTNAGVAAVDIAGQHTGRYQEHYATKHPPMYGRKSPAKRHYYTIQQSSSCSLCCTPFRCWQIEV